MNRSCFVPPSGFNPNASAIPSSRVDFPEPFSPTKNVTGVSNLNSVRWRMAGTEYGYSARSGPSERTRATVWMKMPGTVGASLGRRFFIAEGVPASCRLEGDGERGNSAEHEDCPEQRPVRPHKGQGSHACRRRPKQQPLPRTGRAL